MAKSTKEKISVSLTKSNVWEYQENDIFRIWESIGENAEIMDNTAHLLSIIRTAFELEEVKIDKPEVIKKYEARGMIVGIIVTEDGPRKYAIKKRSIKRVTDLTYENIHHISASKLLEIIDRNFGGGWESLSQSIKDIIEAGFNISTTTLPKDRLHKAGGMYEKKIADGFEVLEIAKGTWVEAIFAKVKPEVVVAKKKIEEPVIFDDEVDEDGEDNADDEEVEIQDDYYKSDEDDDEYDDDKLTEESYRTTIEESPEDMSLDEAEISDESYEE